ncbi:MAG TPA: hypothetical protein VF250_02890 [Conexibacter sp.]
MHYEDRITDELFDEEQDRLRAQRLDAEHLIARLSVTHDDIGATLDLALEIIGENLPGLYRRADDTIRRLVNQAIFAALYVRDEDITRAELAEPFAAVRCMWEQIRALDTRRVREMAGVSADPENAETPVPWGTEVSVASSISEKMVERTWRRANHSVVVSAALAM